MKTAIIGASGKTGKHLARGALGRGHEVVAVCREGSEDKLAEFEGEDGFSPVTAPVVSDEATLTRALAGCDAVVVVLISVRRLKATDLVASLAEAADANGVKRFVFTAGEVTAAREEGERFTFRQRLILLACHPLSWLTPYSVTDMIRASLDIRRQPGWEWTIVRAPTLRDAPAAGYRFCEISEVTSSDALSREDYAACMLDSLGEPGHHRRILTVVSA